MCYLQRLRSASAYTVWSESVLVARIFYDYFATDWISFGVSTLKSRLHRLILVYTCQNVTLLEITFISSIYFAVILMIVEVVMTMYLYFVSCTRTIDIIASDLDLLKCYICIIYVIVLRKVIVVIWTTLFCICKTKTQISLTVTTPLFCALVSLNR